MAMEMQSAKLFSSQNVLLTQENILDILNVIIGTIDPSTQNKKVTSKNFVLKKMFFFKNKFFEVTFLFCVERSMVTTRYDNIEDI